MDIENLSSFVVELIFNLLTHAILGLCWYFVPLAFNSGTYSEASRETAEGPARERRNVNDGEGEAT